MLEVIESNFPSVIKRTGLIESFKKIKIENAVKKAMKSAKVRSKTLPDEITDEVIERVTANYKETVKVDEIHQTVENVIMDMGLHDLAREYIGYRLSKMPDIFRPRKNLKPYEYPSLLEYKDAIRHSYWVHTEFSYDRDVQDMKVRMSKEDAEVVERAMLAISQIEVKVKKFWSKIGDTMPKPEIDAVGQTFSDSEVRHMDAYSHLLELLGLDEKFKEVIEVPAIKARMDYMDRATSTPINNQDYFHNIILFSMFVENVSLFSQFLILMSFNKFNNRLSAISNAVEATSKEEDIHARFGFEVVNIIKKENPDWWTKETVAKIKTNCREAYKAESQIVDWIYGEHELDHLPKAVVHEFLKHRFNSSLESIGIKGIFTVDETLLHQCEWFEEELVTTKNHDFFQKVSTAYNKFDTPITADSI